MSPAGPAASRPADSALKPFRRVAGSLSIGVSAFLAMALVAIGYRTGHLSWTEGAALSGLAMAVLLMTWSWRASAELGRAEKEMRRALEEAEKARNSLQDEVMQRTAALTSATIKAEGARARLQAVMEGTPELICALDTEYRFVVANQSYVEAARSNQGVTIVPGMTYEQVFQRSTTYLPVGKESWRRALAGERFNTVDEVDFPNGKTVVYERSYGPVIDSHGYIIGAVGVLRDITEREGLEREAAQNRVLVERRNRDLETLLHVVSHDLKEPLRSIESFSRLLSSRHTAQLDEKGIDFLDRVVKATGRMGQLLEEIQLLARARQAEPAMGQVDGNDVVKEVLAQLDGTIRETKAQIEIQPVMPNLRVQRVWATQALYNLVANALKFHEDGKPARIEVLPWRQDGLVGFQVLDRGPGVPVEQSDRIFELFQRGVGREVPGTGAGLAIVRQIAERHGGRAWVEPRRGGGSVFTVAFAADGDRAA